MWSLCLASFSIMFPGFFHIVACIITSFIFMAEQYSIVFTDHLLSVHSFGDGYLDSFHYLTVVNSAFTNIGMQVSISVPFNFIFWYIPRNRVAESYGI